ncbi:MAG: GIY-YIG nuclease family protein [Bacteroidales bacterium]|nr:GIY-YIG nuclease family protein [Bacteroidales bacterium]
MITIQELLYNRGLDKQARVKLVRHKDNRCDLYYEYRNNKEWFYKYQSSQHRPVFKNTDYIVSFIGEEGLSSRFIGVFKVKGVKEQSSYNTNDLTDGHFIYELEKVEDKFDDLSERVIIKWSNAKSWHQWYDKLMEVIEIQPGLHYKQFTDYFEFILNFEELKEIINNEYRDWKRMLSATKGVYLIQDTETGKLYVGSAYGDEGIWGRWREYVKTNGHGGNKTLIELIEKDPFYAKKFQYSILMLLPKTITPDEAIKKESLFKNKLGTNSFGLNNN